MQIHSNFRFDNQVFNDSKDLLSYIKHKYEEHHEFLQNFLDSTPYIIAKTSGSTGKPKSIIISKKAMLASAEATGIFFNLLPNTKALHCLSSQFIAGKMMWVRALHLGWHLTVVPVDSSPLKYNILDYDFAAMVPLQVENSLKELKRIDKLIIGGGSISDDLFNKLLLNKTTQCYQTYGMTETITHIAVRRIEKENKFYQTLPNISIDVDNRNCLVINAPQLFNKKIFTNDIVKVISKTRFEWLGRFDNVINTGGIKIFPEVLERKIYKIVSKKLFVSKLPDNRLGEQVILIVESSDAIPNLEIMIRQSNLSKYEIPKQIYYLPKFIYTENHKINRLKTLELILK